MQNQFSFEKESQEIKMDYKAINANLVKAINESVSDPDCVETVLSGIENYINLNKDNDSLAKNHVLAALRHTDEKGRTPLMLAILRQNFDAAKQILEFMQVHFEGDVLEELINIPYAKNKRSALNEATRRGEIDIVKTLFELKADIKHEDGKGINSLILAAAHGHPQVVSFFIDKVEKKKSYIAYKSPQNHTALSAALSCYQLENVKLLAPEMDATVVKVAFEKYKKANKKLDKKSPEFKKFKAITAFLTDYLSTAVTDKTTKSIDNQQEYWVSEEEQEAADELECEENQLAKSIPGPRR